MKKTILLLIPFFLSGIHFSLAQTLGLPYISPDGGNISSINDTYKDGDTLYIAGEFSKVGYQTGSAAKFSFGNPRPRGPFPFIDGGTVFAATSDGNGGWYVGGQFDQIGYETRLTLGHILADGSVDPDFSPTTNYNVRALSLDNNILYIGGQFTQVSGQQRSYLAALDATTGALLNWNPVLDDLVEAIYVDSNFVYVGGHFNYVNGRQQQSFAKFDKITGEAVLAPSMNSGDAYVITQGANNRIYIGGGFYAGGFITGNSALLSTNSVLPDYNHPIINGQVFANARDGAGGWYLGGDFTQVGNVSINNLVHILPGGAVDSSFNPSPDGPVNCLVTDGNSLYIGGDFTNINNQNREKIAIIDITNGNLSPWAPQVNDQINTLKVTSNEVWIGGEFTEINGRPQLGFGRLDKNTGNVKPSLSVYEPVGSDASVNAIESYNSEVYLGGNFKKTSYYTGPITALSATSTLPTKFFPFLDQGGVFKIISDGNGGWYVGGVFTQLQVGSQNYDYLLHVFQNGDLDTAFHPQPNSAVNNMALDGNILYVGGTFTTISGQARNRLAAIDITTGSILPWNPDPNSTIQSLIVAGNNVYLGGFFSQIGNQPRNYLASVDKITGTPTSWDPNVNGIVNVLTYHNGYIYAGGGFTQVGGQSCNRLAAIDTTTGNPTAWNPGLTGTAVSILIEGNSLYVAGLFSGAGGQSRGNIAEFDLLTGNLTAWNPNCNSPVRRLATDGVNIYLIGTFSQIGNQSINKIGAVDKITGNPLTNWQPVFNSNSNIQEIFVDGNDILVGGAFVHVGEQTREGILSYDSLTQKITNWNPGGRQVNAILFKNGKMYIGGYFSAFDGQPRSNLAQVDMNTGLLTSWNPDPNDEIFALVSDGSNLYVGGDYYSIAGTFRRNLVAFDLITDALVGNWNPGNSFNSKIRTLGLDGTNLMVGGLLTYFHYQTGKIMAYDTNLQRAVGWNLASSSTNDKIFALFSQGNLLYAGGSFNSFAGASNNNLVAINTMTGLATSWSPSINSNVWALGGNDSTIIVGGTFTQVNGESIGNLVALDATTGATDSSWNMNQDPSISISVRSIETDNNNIFVGGNFRFLGTRLRDNIAAVDLNTYTITDFKPNVSHEIKSLDVSGESIFIGGDFGSVNFQLRFRLAEINKLTSQLMPWNPEANQPVEIVKVDGNRILVGGEFYQINNQPQSYLAAIDTAGNLTSWNPNPNGAVRDLLIEGDTLYVGGDFTEIDNIPRTHLAAIDKNTGSLFNWDLGVDGAVKTFFATPSKIYVGGSFTQIGGKIRDRIAAIVKHTNTITNWDPGANGSVYDIHVFDQHVFYGGNFTLAAGLSVKDFAYVNANTGLAYPLNPGFNGSEIRHITTYDSILSIGGRFNGLQDIYLVNRVEYTFPSSTFEPKIEAIVANIGGNTGNATVNIFGSGFENAVSVKLKKNGQTDIEMPDSLISIIDGIQIVGPFDLQGAAIGFWDVEVVLPNGTILSLPQGFEIQQGTAGNLSIDLIGFNSIRPNRWQNYVIDVKNNGLNDANGVPLWFAISDNFDVDISFDIQYPDSIGTPADTFDQYILMDSLGGEAFSCKVFSFLIPQISPGANKLVTISIKAKDNNNGKFWAWVQPPWFEDSLSTNIWDCFYMRADTLAIANGNGPLTSGVNCFYTTAREYYQYLIDANFQLNGNTNSASTQVLQNVVSLFGGLGDVIDSCTNGMITRDELLQSLLNTEINTSNATSAEICNPSPPLLSSQKKTIEVIQSLDPNDKTGPEKWVNSGEQIPYLIRFENVDSATAAVQTVLVLDTLDQSVFDLNTFELGMITVGDQIYSIPPGQKSHSLMIDLRPAQNLILNIEASLDKNKGIARWEFTSLEPTTMELTADPLAGFLPPNVTAPEGEGSVFFTIKTKPNLPTETEIENEAHIYFDNNDVIITDPWINEIDEVSPQSAVAQLSPWISNMNFTVEWSGSDLGSGIRYYDVYVATNDGDFERWLSKTLDSSAVFQGIQDSTYSFYSIATDSAGNIEDAPAIADATTQLVAVGIDEPLSTQPWSYHLYPNPNTGSFNLEITNPQREKISIELLDLRGKRILQRTIKQLNQIESFSADHLPDGIYLLKMQTKTELKVERVIIKH
ncbi:MAG: T9SS type A sorting domain-containing protein [Bacteroidetes bacterium]|nr:T9SS type A sorting domain-containing protein [Bacteroidota bacterium]